MGKFIGVRINVGPTVDSVVCLSNCGCLPITLVFIGLVRNLRVVSGKEYQFCCAVHRRQRQTTRQWQQLCRASALQREAASASLQHANMPQNQLTGGDRSQPRPFDARSKRRMMPTQLSVLLSIKQAKAPMQNTGNISSQSCRTSTRN